MPIFIILLIIVAVTAVWVWFTYNSLVKSAVRVDEAWSDITVQLKRRYDLIPNLVNTVKGYADHEKEVFEEVTKARTEAMNATGSPAEQAEAENQFAGALKSLFAVAEDYPELKADRNFLQLQEELVDTEDKIQAARRFYNGSVRDLNIKVRLFPTNLIAQSIGFKEREFFEVENEDALEEVVKVQFGGETPKSQ